MNFKKILVPMAAIAATVFVGQAIAQGLAGPPELKLTLAKEAAVSKDIKGELSMTFEDGWHGYPNPPTLEYNIPVTLTSGTKEFTMGKIEYPKGEDYQDMGSGKIIKVYQGTVKIPFTVKTPAKAGAYKFKLNVSYQQCNHQMCQPPDEIHATSEITIK